MKITFITMFPEGYDGFLKMPLPERAMKKEIAEISVIDLKQYADGSFRHMDDSPYGGGRGMILKYPLLFKALQKNSTLGCRKILISASGRPFTQKKVRELLQYEHLILIAGHYEGVDERFAEEADECISVGDYILSGGEIPSQIVADAVIRLLPGIIRAESTEEESYENGLLEYPQYTKPVEYNGKRVPDVLLSGNHEAIRRYRLKESLRKTLHFRRDLLEKKDLNEEEKSLLEEILQEECEH